MSASIYGWEVGHVLSEDEVANLESSGDLDELVAVTTHPTPGGYFTDPYAGTYLLKNSNGDCFASLPDVSDPDSEPNEVVYLGKAVADDEVLGILTAFILADDHEAAAAINFHFDKSDFGTEEWFWQSLPEFYWFRFGTQIALLGTRLDLELKTLSPLYKQLAEFFDDPNSASFEAFRRELDGRNFEDAYMALKYNQAGE